MISAAAGKSLGKLFRNFTNPRWLFQQAAETTTSLTVLNWAGKQVSAKKKGHVLESDKKVADHYHCDDGHDYLVVDGTSYRYDHETDAWYHA